MKRLFFMLQILAMNLQAFPNPFVCSSPIQFVVNKINIQPPLVVEQAGDSFSIYKLKRTTNDLKFPQFSDSVYNPASGFQMDKIPYSKKNHVNYTSYSKSLADGQYTAGFYSENFILCNSSDGSNTSQNTVIPTNSLQKNNIYTYRVNGDEYNFHIQVSRYVPEDPSSPKKCPNDDSVQYYDPVKFELQTYATPFSSDNDKLDFGNLLNSQIYYLCVAKNQDANVNQANKCKLSKVDPQSKVNTPFSMNLVFLGPTNVQLQMIDEKAINPCLTFAN